MIVLVVAAALAVVVVVVVVIYSSSNSSSLAFDVVTRCNLAQLDWPVILILTDCATVTMAFGTG